MSEHAAENPREREDELVDEMSEESFPDSDPPSTWAGPDVPPVNRRETGTEAP